MAAGELSAPGRADDDVLEGNYPQGFSHIGLIQAAARLDLALRIRDEGTERPPLLSSDFQSSR